MIERGARGDILGGTLFEKGTSAKECVWCKNPNADEDDLTDPLKELCHFHLCELDGESPAGYDRRVNAYFADWA